MRPRIYFYPYNKGSKSVWNLVESMNALIIKRVGSHYVYRPGDVVINWGCYNLPNFGRIINQPTAVETATSKLKTFAALKEAKLPIPEYTTDKTKALKWLRNGHVLGRDIDRGSEGAGITTYTQGSDRLGDHKFYVKYKRKVREFRVHVFQGRVIDIQEKLRSQGHDNALVRNTANGYVFARGSLERNPVPEVVHTAAIRAVSALRLDFGGVDIGLSKDGTVLIYEINTAPGIEGTTVTKYRQAIEAL